MRHGCVVLAWTVCLLACLGSALAQDGPTSYVFGEYYKCDQNREAYAAKIVEQAYGPIYQKYIDSGDLTGWRMLQHNAGGSWRLVIAYVASDMRKLMETRDKMIQDMQGMDETREFTDICSDHDDLVWGLMAGSPPSAVASGGPASYSIYYRCGQARQDRADEIFRQTLAPEFEKLTQAGEVSTWSWGVHVIGGPFRRLLTLSGADHVTLLGALMKANQAASQAHPDLTREFAQSCGSHDDYFWDVLWPKPAAGN